MGILEPFYERGRRRLWRRIGAEINKIKGLCECYREWKNFVGLPGFFCTRDGRRASAGKPHEHLSMSASS